MAALHTLAPALRSKRFLAILLVTLATATLVFFHTPRKATVLAHEPFIGTSVDEFQAHAYALAGGRARPTCTWQRFHQQRYAVFDVAPRRNVFVAINFWNNEEVLPTFFQEFPAFVEKLGREHVYVSIYENGSEDKTPELLQLFADMLTFMTIPHTVVARGRNEYSHKENGHRINVLAAIRNAAMDPLYNGAAARALGAPLDDVLWINDVFHCTADLLEVLYQRQVQGADQACAVDWAGWGDHVIYDRWVLRSMTGRVFYISEELQRWMYPHEGDPRQPDGRGILPQLLPYDAADRARFEANLPIQVFSCWNGATAIAADAFLPPNNLRFRVAKADLDENGRPKEVTELISECFLSSVDLWKVGRGKIVLAPRASVAYNTHNYDDHRKDQLRPPYDPQDEIVTFSPHPPAQVAFQDNAKWDSPERWGPWDEQ